ncbi:MAG: PilZ domain-containing protein [Butyrivibrio sp.]|nr:PilZ domain-containing protein [Butyrivibrio sp.]
MEERRKITRVDYKVDSILVDRDSLEKYYCKVKNISPLGVALSVSSNVPSLLNRDVIIVAETLIMYADVVREEEESDGERIVALKARNFTPDVLQYLFERIGSED